MCNIIMAWAKQTLLLSLTLSVSLTLCISLSAAIFMSYTPKWPQIIAAISLAEVEHLSDQWAACTGLWTAGMVKLLSDWVVSMCQFTDTTVAHTGGGGGRWGEMGHASHTDQVKLFYRDKDVGKQRMKVTWHHCYHYHCTLLSPPANWLLYDTRFLLLPIVLLYFLACSHFIPNCLWRFSVISNCHPKSSLLLLHHSASSVLHSNGLLLKGQFKYYHNCILYDMTIHFYTK